MLDTSTRLLRLLSLMQTRPDRTGPELAECLEVTPRTVRRDIERLRELGYPITSVGGVGGGYRLGPGGSLPPLLLDDEEAVAVAVGLETAAAGTVTGIGESSARALAKLHQVLPVRLRSRVRSLSSALVSLPVLGPTVDPGTLTAIASAVRGHERLRFDYRGMRDAPSRREAEPYRLVHNERRWYLFAWDTGREDWRSFRVDRMALREPNGPRFRPRPLPAEGVAEHVTLGVTTKRRHYQAVLTMYAGAREVADEVPAYLGLIEPVDADTCVLRIGSDSLDQLAVWVAAFGFDFEVREPPELIDHLHTLTARLRRAADASSARRGS
ncbi:WYL domain-containing protein [Streptomyces sp. HNM0574]|uniref:helix-turn-helix transcriptional regulator n=1 Tax=Streptomyces sp. HNM0574 TaxID=2714954 RepID=UPI00146AB345|nr:WYL domain-containing protein [Streptomyces sp. HNM0574]NLU68349.1 WYL domain-containing protein [Streptomyces sp. HNM0574]